jgi:DNA repair exonuclease SbcCD ATPase subunit
MKTSFAVAVATALVADGAAVTPVQKVVEMMNGMLEQGKKEKNEEQVQFAAYKQFCDDTSVEKKRSIAEAEEAIEVLKADIEKCTADAEALSEHIEKLDEDIAVWEGDVKAATKVREIEKADYDVTHKDYSESIDALERAIGVLKKQDKDRAQASLLQLSAQRLVPDEARRTIESFLSEDPDEGLAVSAPEANAYESASGGVIEMLSKLLDKFIDERTTLEKEEMNAKHAYDMLMQDLKAEIDQAKTDRGESAETKSAKLQKKADAEGDVKDTTGTMEEDKKYLEDLTATCEQKASDFESRQHLRAEEIEAVEKAIEIVSSGAVSGNADKHLPGFIQGSAMAQLRTSETQQLQMQRQHRVAKFLQERAAKTHSQVLSLLAERVESGDPFGQVKKMIKDLIVKLMEEANEEAEHKGWCDTELSTNEQTRKEKTVAVEGLTSDIDELQASIAKLTEDLTELTEAVAELDAAVSKATKLREEEKAKNTQTISDAGEAQTAVAQALTVLKEFYAKAAEATAFVQTRQEPPESFDEPYQGMGGKAGGVVGMLEVIESDFARLEADTKAAEASGQKEYDGFMSDSEVDKASKTTDIEHKTQKKQDEEQALTEKKGDLEGTQKELDAALAYFDKLKPSCVDSGASYEDRVARRKEEIESLQEALKILNGEDLA